VNGSGKAPDHRITSHGERFSKGIAMNTDASIIRTADVVLAVMETLSAYPDVAAIALGGSQPTLQADAGSDYDIYVYADADIPLDLRRELAERFDPAPEIGNTWFGPGDEWSDRRSGASVDIMYWERPWFERQIGDVIERCQPSLGYTTSFWFTLRHSVRLFDRHGWLARQQALAATPYPEKLRRRIIAWNHPLLRTTRSSYRHQIELAIQRDDPVSVQHRSAALLASMFDIIFALNRTLHPGEKRQLAHVARLGEGVPEGFEDQVRDVLRASADPARNDLLMAIDALCDGLNRAIKAESLWHLVKR